MYNVIGMKGIKKGFTLVELIIVIAIMAILSSSVVVIAITGNLQKARDSKRKTDLEAFRSALEQYRSDNLGAYPAASTSLAPNYLTSPIPDDPLSTRDYLYEGITVAGKITQYYMYAAMEVGTNQTGTYSGKACGTGITCNYRVNQP